MQDLLQADDGRPARALHLVNASSFAAWRDARPEPVRRALEAQRFEGKGYQVATFVEGEETAAVLGVADPDSLSPWCLARAAELLPEGSYRVAGRGPGPAALGWMLGQYRFDRYRAEPERRGPRVLLTAEERKAVAEVAQAVGLVRDLVNTPASDLGPAELEAAVRAEADRHGAELSVTMGEELERRYPMVHAVGRAAAPERAPRMIALDWGDLGATRLAVIGKGVCFDTGGLNIKSTAGMAMMKKDMGGAAHALALARLIMGAGLPVRLQLLIPAVENAVSGKATRPGDVLRSAKGDTVEITNTDAEGRLILADALCAAAAREPDLMLDFATLTGAARVALGPHLPALFTPDDALAEALLRHGSEQADPVWRLPLWEAYGEMLKSEVADTTNAASGSHAGAITAALFLQRFAGKRSRWAHLDTYAWNDKARPGRPKGGEALGLRAAWALVRERTQSNGPSQTEK